jgi:hypothetical protein
MAMVFCRGCAKEIHETAVTCPYCGASQGVAKIDDGISDKDFLATLILCLFLGVFGAHRFFVGKSGSGILQVLTLGGLGIWTLIDFVVILTGNFKDSEGKKIAE